MATDPYAAFTRQPAEPFNPDSPGSFLGKDMAWPLREDPDTGDIAGVEGYESISESLHHLLLLSFNEVPGFERMGTNADEVLFNNDPSSARDLFIFSARNAIQQYETRVELLDIRFILEPLDTLGNRYAANIRVRYRVKASNEVTENVYPFNLTLEGDRL